MVQGQVWCLLFVSFCAHAFSAPAFKETFDDSWTSRWKKSTWKTSEGTDGVFTLTAGKWYGDDQADKGIQTGPDARFFASYSTLPTPYDNTGKDLVLQFSVKHEQKLDCGGGYIKLFTDAVSEKDMESFSGDTPYAIMFGPDICGFGTKKVHVILNYKGENHLVNKNIECKTDELTHVYTLVLKPDNTYEVLIDTESVEKGSLYEDWNMLPPKQFQDPEASKPEDWDERAMIVDPNAVKPDDWDDDTPQTIPDPDAEKPDDWDEEEDGVWEPPMKTNPDFKGEWIPGMIENPAYKGKWEHPMIDNPDYKEDPELYKFAPIKYVGFELWQVKAGSIFDNIMISDSLEEATAFAKETWGKNMEAEKKMMEAIKEKDNADAEAASQASAASMGVDDLDDLNDEL